MRKEVFHFQTFEAFLWKPMTFYSSIHQDFLEGTSGN